MIIRMVFLLIVAFTTSIVSAQTHINYGIKGGMNYSTISSENFMNFEPKTDYALGLFYEHQLSSSFFIQPEILYTRKGAYRDFSYQGYDAYGNQLGDINVKSYWSINYIQIPVLTKYKFKKYVWNLFWRSYLLSSIIKNRK
jgi:hypothetical protein